METLQQKISILLVDDNESNLLSLEAILESPDRDLVRAASGDEALHYLLSHDVAVILLDVHMPGIDGLETAELIRGRKQCHDVPIIFLTAHDSPDNANLLKGYSLGAADYMIKPFDPIALRSKVAVFVELYKRSAQVMHQAGLLHEKNIELENANFQRLGKLVELGQRLAAERDPGSLLQLFCDSARDILTARYAAAWIMEEDGQTTRHFVSGAASAALAHHSQIEADILNPHDYMRNPVRLTRICRPSPLVTSPSGEMAVVSVLLAPILYRERPLGGLYLAERLDADEFSEADERLALTLTAQAAVEYENARLYAGLQQHAADLEKEVTERKRVEQERLRLLESEKAARQEAEDASRSKDEFLAIVSHELRTPLNAMLGWARLLRDKKLDEVTAGQAIEVIERNAMTQARIVEDILEASRIITGKLSLDLFPVELGPILDAAADSLRPVAQAKNVRLELSLCQRLSPVLGDSARLEQIVTNLLSNAIKFTPSGGLVEAKLGRDESYADLTVKDTGQGISAEFLPYVFERFRQADSSITRAHGGLGLGLAIVRHLVELHDGTVAAYSEGKGKGATFEVRLPLATSREDHHIDALYPGSQSHRRLDTTTPWQPVPELAGVRVLVVDDEADARDLARAIIEQHSAVVRCAGSTQEAMGLIVEWKPQLLLSDIGMPGEDGYSLIRQVRELPADQGGEIPAAAMTAYASPEDRVRALASGFQAHIAKPIDQIEMVAIVAELAARCRQTNGNQRGTQDYLPHKLDGPRT